MPPNMLRILDSVMKIDNQAMACMICRLEHTEHVHTGNRCRLSTACLHTRTKGNQDDVPGFCLGAEAASLLCQDISAYQHYNLYILIIIIHLSENAAKPLRRCAEDTQQCLCSNPVRVACAHPSWDRTWSTHM